jgi:hypothetical protein
MIKPAIVSNNIPEEVLARCAFWIIDDEDNSQDTNPEPHATSSTVYTLH